MILMRNRRRSESQIYRESGVVPANNAVVRHLVRWMVSALALLLVGFEVRISTVWSQETPKSSSKKTEASAPVEVWEYSPYRARVWLSISPTLGLSEETKRSIRQRLTDCVEIEFGPTMQCDVVETPDALFGSVLYHLDDLTIEQLLSRELVLMLAKSEQAKDAFIEMQPKRVETVAADPNKKKMSVKEEEALRLKEIGRAHV